MTDQERLGLSVASRVRLNADCFVGLECGDEGVVVRQQEGLWVVRFDRDGSERHLWDGNLKAAPDA